MHVSDSNYFTHFVCPFKNSGATYTAAISAAPAAMKTTSRTFFLIILDSL